jgi:hypothetical protein
MRDVRLIREMFGKERRDSFELTHHMRMKEAEIHLAQGGGGYCPVGHGLARCTWSRYGTPRTRGCPRCADFRINRFG